MEPIHPPAPFNPPPRSTDIGQSAGAPGWGAVPPPPGVPVPPYGGMLPPAQRVHGLATAALVCGVVGLFMFWLFGIVPLLALIFGLVSARAVKNSNGALRGLPQARAGWILGLIGVIGAAVFLWAVATDRIDTDEDSANNYLEADVGDCIETIPEGTVVYELDFISCDKAHAGETYAIGELNPDRDREYPGSTTVLTEVEQACYDAFEPYVGRSYQTSVWEVYYIYPQALGWSGQRGGYVCFLVQVGKTTVGSAFQSDR